MKRKLMQHFKKLSNAIKQFNGKAMLDLESYCVEVRFDNRTHMLYPQFVTFVEGEKRYTPNFESNVKRFCGWRPYFNRPVPLFSHKLNIKELMSKNGIATPEFGMDGDHAPEGSLIKRSNSSFGSEIRGPLKSPSKVKLNKEKEEFYEKFITGKILKTWFWNDKAVCVEMQEMARVKGDGSSTIEALVNQRMKKKKKPVKLEQVAEVLDYFGKRLDTVLAEGELQLVDFRYSSPLIPNKNKKEVSLGRKKEVGGRVKAIRKQAKPIGELLWNSLPEEERSNIVYTVDGILDDDDTMWVLEVNANPFVHPFVYKRMIKSLSETMPGSNPMAPDHAEGVRH